MYEKKNNNNKMTMVNKSIIIRHLISKNRDTIEYYNYDIIRLYK